MPNPNRAELLNTLDQLERNATAAVELQQQIDLLNVERNRLIYEATNLGGTRREVAERALLTRGRVQQILDDRGRKEA